MVVACAVSASEILLMDELGLPLGGVAVVLRIGAAEIHTSTLGDGRLCLNMPPGTACSVELAQAHEAMPGQSTLTASGRHFTLNGPGP
jgi:hypothetical protein